MRNFGWKTKLFIAAYLLAGVWRLVFVSESGLAFLSIFLVIAVAAIVIDHMRLRVSWHPLVQLIMTFAIIAVAFIVLLIALFVLYVTGLLR